jgi:hypothetical protein
MRFGSWAVLLAPIALAGYQQARSQSKSRFNTAWTYQRERQ